jgi:hypothetical protein
MSSKIEKEIENYRHGFPYLKVIAPATPEKGISILNKEEQNSSMDYYNKFGGKCVKFVPASGAASRMFKDLFEAKQLLDSSGTIKEGSPAEKFLSNIKHFPFYDEKIFHNFSPLQTINYVLTENGLGYGNKPKGVLLFHKYSALNEVRTPFEEHLVEAALYAKNHNDPQAHIHFTVSPEHLKEFNSLFSYVKEKYENRFNCRFDVAFSFQDPQTDIVAVNEDNTPYVKNDGTVLTRPGGHGALLSNLNSIDSDIIFLKNIDNVVHQSFIDETVIWKKVLGGKLLQIRDKVFSYLNNLEINQSDSFLSEIVCFMKSTFQVSIPDIPKELMAQYLFAKLNRPIRVCGMVKNEGEPGGGPFIVYDADGATSLQILESVQLDPLDPYTKTLLKSSTHFNPVDVVCSIKNYKGEKFDLSKYIDNMTGFISHKSYEGHSLKAQELPGLWNGSMSNWNTVFVETPLITFNPVKTILDLLRKEHSSL